MRKIFFLFIFSLLLSSCDNDDSSMQPIIGENDFSSELFFTEYVEGTSFNKALEIVNLTGRTIDLEQAGYSIKKQSNGEGNWMGEVVLTGHLTHNEVFVIANASADIPEILELAHQVKAGAPMDFNGNDPIGLFKNDELIDVIGEVDNPLDFAKDVTLRRSKEFQEPSTIFKPEEWEVFEVNTIEDLGRY